MTHYIVNQIKLVPEKEGVAIRLLYESAPQKGDCYSMVEWHHIRTIRERWDAGYPWYQCCPAYHLDREVIAAIVAVADELLA